MDKNLIFFSTLCECFKDDARNLPLIESEGAIIGPADQVVGVDVLDDPQWTSHALGYAKSLPKCSDTGWLSALTPDGYGFPFLPGFPLKILFSKC